MTDSSSLDPVGRLRDLATASISDAQQSFGTMHPSIRPLALGMRLCGPAHTVKCYPGSIVTVHKALLEAQPGDILVVDGEGDARGALFGELMTQQALANGLGGVVIDGPIRDCSAVVSSGLSVFASGTNPRVGTNRRVGQTQIAVQCGGVVVHPGDFILGDDDGVAVIAVAQLAAVLDAAEAIKRKEVGYREAMAKGQQLADLIGLRDGLLAGVSRQREEG